MYLVQSCHFSWKCGYLHAFIRICPLFQQIITGQIRFLTMAMTKLAGLSTCFIQLDVMNLLLKKKDFKISPGKWPHTSSVDYEITASQVAWGKELP